MTMPRSGPRVWHRCWKEEIRVSNKDQLPLEQYWGVIRRWWWLIVASVLVASLSSYLSVSRAPRIYRATTTVVVGQGMEQANPDYTDLYVSERLAQTYINMVQRRPVLQGAAAALDLPYAPSSGSVSARLVEGTQFVEISVRDSSPEHARDLADEIARQLILQTPTDSLEDRERRAFVQQQLQDLEENIEETRAEIDEEQARLDGANSARAIQQYQGNIAALRTKLSTYQSSYASLLQTSQGGTNYISIFEQASTPSYPVSPRVMETVALAAAIGLILALGGAFLTEFLDDTLKTVDDATRATGMTSLGAIPRIPGDGDADRLFALHRPRSSIAEAFRALRTNVRFSSLDRPLRTVVVTSADPSEGKSVVLANLAVVMAQEGRSVIVVDSDLRLPTQQKIFEMENKHGLSDAILEEQPDLAVFSTQLAPERLVESFAEDMQGARQASISGMGELRVMTSGPIPPNPADMLGSQRMAGLIEQLTEQADVVLFDCPPVLAVTDPIALAQQVDGVLLVVDAGHSRRARVQRAVEHLRQIEAPLLGVITNRVASRRRGYGSYYYYSYGEEERASDEQSKKRRGRVKRRRAPDQDRRPASRLFRSHRKGGERKPARRNGEEPESAPMPAARLMDNDRAGVQEAAPRPKASPATDVQTTRPLRIPRDALPRTIPDGSQDRTQDAKETQRFRLSDVQQQIERNPPDTSSETDA